MKRSKDISAFEARLGVTFKDPSVLVRAVTHSSIGSPTREHNQRLEFLGDRVLGLVVAEALFQANPKDAEGKLAPRFNALVRKETCADIAGEIGLGNVLRMGRSEMLTGGRRKQALLGDAMEAVIAAAYLDGGYEVAKGLILRLWGERIAQVDTDARDAKTILQEWAQARKMPPPTYGEIGRTGPDHAPVFKIEARLSDGKSAVGQATSKRAAEQAAAQQLLDDLAARAPETREESQDER